jgi:hypothetical protein
MTAFKIAGVYFHEWDQKRLHKENAYIGIEQEVKKQETALMKYYDLVFQEAFKECT